VPPTTTFVILKDGGGVDVVCGSAATAVARALMKKVCFILKAGQMIVSVKRSVGVQVSVKTHKVSALIA